MEIGEGDGVDAGEGFCLMELRWRAVAPIGVVEIDTFERRNGGDALECLESVFHEMDVFLISFDEFRKRFLLRCFAVQSDDILLREINIEMTEPRLDKTFLLGG